MTEEEHRQRHVELHRALDELTADWARHNTGYGDQPLRLFSNTTIMELMQWSHRQTIKPDVPKRERGPQRKPEAQDCSTTEKKGKQ